ncbi:MAG: hypothetical protein K9M07_00505 [Simkaniaceae bacterium]|nr:hypothetical protein [Simkaniaceae bacterium]
MPSKKCAQQDKKSKFFFISLLISSIAAIAFLIVQGIRIELPFLSNPIIFYSNHHCDNHKLLFIQLIDRAQDSIDLSIFALTDRDVIHHLNRKAKEGLTITVYYDDHNSPNLESKLNQRIQSIKKSHCHLMHQKILIIDETIALFGSTNITLSSLLYHQNILVSIYHPQLAKWLKANMNINGQDGHFHSGSTHIHLYTMPDTTHKAINHLLQCIEKAQIKIHGALFALSHQKIIHALQNAYQKDIDVSFILDRGQGNRHCSGFPIHLSKSYELMHQKACYIDHDIAILGSVNWTHSGFKKNRDLLVIFENLSPQQMKQFKIKTHPQL